jgi:hypothetical protein
MRCYGILTIVLSVFDLLYSTDILWSTGFTRYYMAALYYVYVVVMRNLFAAAVVTAVVSVVYVASVTLHYIDEMMLHSQPYVHTLLVHTYTPSTHIHTSPVPTCTHARTHTSSRAFIIHTTEST